jgi:hypothetical protein
MMNRLAPFFVSPPAWVLVHEGAGGELHVATESDDEGRAILCFLSPLDALIEAARFTQLGQAYHVMLAACLDGCLFRDATGAGWLRAFTPDGRPRTDAFCCAQAGRWAASPGRYTADGPPWFEVDPATIEMIDGLHERAGLFAWRETHSAIYELDAARLREAAGLALRTASVTVVADTSNCDGVGLFDPEFGQWHCVAHPRVKLY